MFPAKEWKRLSGVSKPIDFSEFDPEQLDHSDTTDAGPAVNWGNSIYVTTEVDPKPHWLPVRPDWEIHHQKQYYKFLTGQKGQEKAPNEDGSYDIPFVKIGPPPNTSGTNTHLQKELNDRKVYVRDTKDDNNDKFMAYKPYALITLPATARYPEVDIGELWASLGGRANELCIPLTKSGGQNALLSAWVMGMETEAIRLQTVVALMNLSKQGVSMAPDMSDSKFIAAAYKPWHAGIPQQSNIYKWGPWASSNGFGKAELDVDDSLHPGSFNSNEKMNEAGITRVRSAMAKVDRFIESGSVTIAGFGKNTVGWCGNANQTTSYPDRKNEQACTQGIPAGTWHGVGANYHNSTSGPGLGDRLIGNGPYITDINVSIGANGVVVTYSLSQQRRFGDTTKLEENRILNSTRRVREHHMQFENSLKRTKRGIDTWKKPTEQ